MKSTRLFILTAALALLGPSSNALADAVLSIVPPTGSIVAGQTFTVGVYVTGPTVSHSGTTYPSPVTDLASFQFDIAFNCIVPTGNATSCAPGASLLNAVSVTEGSFLPDGGSNITFFEPGTIDNTNGEISTIGDVGISGVTGSGTLVDLTFLALGTGTTDISILANSDLQLYDSNFDPIVVADSVTTSPTTQTFPTNQFLTTQIVVTPEPPSIQLLILGAVAALFAFAARTNRLRNLKSN